MSSSPIVLDFDPMLVSTCVRSVRGSRFYDEIPRSPHRKSWVALVDGNATQLKILHKLAGQHHVELTIVLDFIHVCEYVWKASLGFYEETEPARQVWVSKSGCFASCAVRPAWWRRG